MSGGECHVKKSWRNFRLFGIINSFLGIAIILINDYLEEYDLLAMEKVEATVVGKTAGKGLFLSPAYYVKVDLNAGKVNDPFTGYLNRVSKKQIKDLQVGDKLSGYSIYGEFSTLRDIVFDSIFFLFGIIFFSLLGLVFPLAILLDIKPIECLLERLDKTGGAKLFWKVIGWSFKVLGIAIVLYFSTRYLTNLLSKVIPIAQTETKAYIVEKDSDISYKKYEDSSYNFTLEYESKTGEKIRVVKDVTRHTYNTYDVYGNVQISYFNGNPYNIFVKGTNERDLFLMAAYNEWLIYTILLLLLCALGFLYFRKKLPKKKKQASEGD